ncbi:MAG TPA: cyclic nucleotide-binding domain-containing protein [Dermatophilaceae bacterium]
MANRREYLEQLASVPLLRSCSKRELERVARVADEVHLEAGRTVVEEGHPGNECYVIISGSATVSREGTVIAEIGPGDHFGELAVLDGGPRTASVLATTDLDLLVIGRREFTALLEDVPGLTHKVLVNLAHWVRQLDEDVYG